MNTAIIYKLLSMVLLALSAVFALCACAGLLLGESIRDDSIQAFILTVAVSIGIALICHILGRKGEAKLFRREALFVIGISWILATFIGALPYILTHPCEREHRRRDLRERFRADNDRGNRLLRLPRIPEEFAHLAFDEPVGGRTWSGRLFRGHSLLARCGGENFIQ